MSRRLEWVLGRVGRARESISPGRRNWLPAVAGAVAAVVVVALASPHVAMNDDAKYGLIAGDQLAHLHRPYLEGFAPQIHPLMLALGVLLSPLDAAVALDVLAVLAIVSFLALVYALFRLAGVLGGVAAGLIAVAVALLSPAIELNAFGAGFLDIPFVALVLIAVARIAESPREIRWGALVALGLAGLLRPEAWGLAFLYGVWLAYQGARGRRLATIAVLVLAAPLLWLLVEWVVTGDPLHPLEVGDQHAQAREQMEGGFVDRPVPERDALSWLPGGELIDGVVVLLYDMLGQPLTVLGGLIALWAVWPLPRPAWPGENRMAFRVVAVAALALLAMLLILDLTDLELVNRYAITPALLLAALVAGIVGLGRPTILLVLVLMVFIGFRAYQPGVMWSPPALTDVEVVSDVIDHQDRRREFAEELLSLAARDEVRDAVARCPKLLVRTRQSFWAYDGRLIVALEFGRDWNQVAILRYPGSSSEYSEFRKKIGPGRPPVRAGGQMDV